ncbi:MAG: translesion DNA synthesis-associated protein ImuA [Thiotrichales bacterium]
MSLEALLQQGAVWRGGESALRPRPTAGSGLPTGYAPLDEALPGAGWPLGALTEILHADAGIGELQLVIPALARLTAAGRRVLWIDPPFIPYAPALELAGVSLYYTHIVRPDKPEDALWALEQGLRSGSCAAVLAWPRHPELAQLRRLQLAAEAGDCVAFLFRPAAVASQSSPAALRLRLTPEARALKLDVIKCRGRFFTAPIRCPLPATQRSAATADPSAAHARFDSINPRRASTPPPHGA